MALFSYEVVDAQGNILEGEIEGDNQAIVFTRLRGMGYLVLDIQEGARRSLAMSPAKKKPKVPLGELSLFSRQLAAMLNAGIPLTRCLFALSEQTASPVLKKAVGEIAGNVEAGMSFADALARHPHIFSKLFVGMVRAGEIGGTLEETLGHLSEQLQKDKSLADNIRSATFYPGMIAGFSVLIMLVMLLFIVPIFERMFPEGTALPLPTRMVMALSASLRTRWYLWILGLLLFNLAARLSLRSSKVQRWWTRTRFRLPVFGPLFQKATVARFARTLSTLLNGGIPILQALDVSGEATGNALIIEAVQQAKEKVEQGSNLAKPLEESGLFPPMVIQMVATGEESGSLVNLLHRVAEFFEEEVAIITKGLTALIEPLMLVFVGLVVGAMVMALYLPVFNLVTQVGS